MVTLASGIYVYKKKMRMNKNLTPTAGLTVVNNRIHSNANNGISMKVLKV
jgi:hypothetical protein